MWKKLFYVFIYIMSYGGMNVAVKKLKGYTKNTATGYCWAHYLNVHFEG
jgi:hypothetical protein